MITDPTFSKFAEGIAEMRENELLKVNALAEAIARAQENAYPKMNAIEEAVARAQENMLPKMNMLAEAIARVQENAYPKMNAIAEAVARAQENMLPKMNMLAEAIARAQENAYPKMNAIAEAVARAQENMIPKMNTLAEAVALTQANLWPKVNALEEATVRLRAIRFAEESTSSRLDMESINDIADRVRNLSDSQGVPAEIDEESAHVNLDQDVVTELGEITSNLSSDNAKLDLIVALLQRLVSIAEKTPSTTFRLVLIALIANLLTHVCTKSTDLVLDRFRASYLAGAPSQEGVRASRQGIINSSTNPDDLRIVIRNGVQAHRIPKFSSTPIFAFRVGDVVHFNEKQGKWVWISWSDGNEVHEGWIPSKYIRVVK